MKVEKMFSEIVLLRQRLSKDGLLEVAHAGHMWTAAFEWHHPVAATIVEETQQQLNKSLPQDYVAFLSHITNGASSYISL